MNELKFDEPVIYVGPNILSYGVMQFQSYINGLPEFVSRAIEKIPEIKIMLVAASELEKMRAKIADTSTYENRIFKKIQKTADEIRRNKTHKKEGI